ncbi:hypothetical protein GCM10020256_30440 [Streptomyces thermocoprophilus]
MIFAKEMRSGAVLAPLFVFAVEAVREAAKRGVLPRARTHYARTGPSPVHRDSDPRSEIFCRSVLE